MSVAMHTSDTIDVKKQDRLQDRLLAFEMKCYRKILRIRWKQKIMNEFVQEPYSVYSSVSLYSGESRGQTRPWPPHRSWQWSSAHLGGRKSNDSIVNLSKCKDIGPTRIDVGYGFGPLRINTTLKHE